MVGELRDFDATEEKGIFGFFKKQSNKIEAMKNRYAKAEVNVQKIVDSPSGAPDPSYEGFCYAG